MKKLKGWLKEFLVIAVFCIAVEFIPGVGAVMVPIGVIGVIYLLVKLLGRRKGGTGTRRARRESAPHRAGRKAGSAFYGAAMDWMTPKPPTQAELDYKARQEAKQKYAFHSAQAAKYKGTRDGWWHEQEANKWRNKMR